MGAAKRIGGFFVVENRPPNVYQSTITAALIGVAPVAQWMLSE
jgi:hypothetical protein